MNLLMTQLGGGVSLPIKILAVTGAACMFGFLAGLVLTIAVKATTGGKLPPWMLNGMRLLGAVIAGLFVYSWLSGPGGGIGGGGSGLWPGGKGGSNGDGQAKSDKEAPKVKPKDKDANPIDKKLEIKQPLTEEKGTYLIIEVLDNETLKKIAKSEKPEFSARYRVRDDGVRLLNRDALKDLIRNRQAASPPLKTILFKKYADAPDDANYWYTPVEAWARERKLEVGYSSSSKAPPLD